VFEVDHPATQDWKRRALAAAKIAVPDGVTFVPADLAADSPAGPLAAAGFDAAAPALVSWLGVTMYLAQGAIGETLTAIGGFAPGTEVIADYMLPEDMRDEAGAVYGTLVAQASAERGEPWLSSFAPGEMTDLACRSGFGAVRNVRQRQTIAAALWRRADALLPVDLAVLFHATVTAPSGAGENLAEADPAAGAEDGVAVDAGGALGHRDRAHHADQHREGELPP
jgi:O-methyltransferase involved in polyketide biosynthesis